MQQAYHYSPDVVLIGGGIMSATLALLLHELEPGWQIEVFERLDQLAAESSDAWNNAGTGHAANCELNYTPENEDGSIDCKKAFKINEQFEKSKQFWAYLVEKGILKNPAEFIHSMPHLSFVKGEENVEFLKKRHAALTESHLFADMLYTEDPAQIAKWVPLMMAEREDEEPVAATRIEHGTDVDFGALSRAIFRYLNQQDKTTIHLQHEVEDLERDPEQPERWQMVVRNLADDSRKLIKAPFVFIGAGGHSLLLLEKSDIPEAEGYGGFPVGGQWLRCTNPAIIAQHHAKVYGRASVGTPPMSVPHLDTRIINGQQELLFGPFAGFSTKFLKHGSYWDLLKSIALDNLIPMIRAGLDNLPLTAYLVEQVMQSDELKMEALREYYPNAKIEDWDLEIAGQRVQVIKKDEEKGGILEFGTEIVHAADGTVAALLGASPGASTAVAAMLQVLEHCFSEKLKSDDWEAHLKKMIPSYGRSLAQDAELCREVRAWSDRVLGLG
jgi:malate dehydrogenase (quinone)